MLYRYPIFRNHISFRLNRNVIYFFCKLRYVDGNSSLNPLSNYFSNDFASFLATNKQTTLRNLFTVFFNVFKNLPENERKLIIKKFQDSQKISLVIHDTTIDCHDYCLPSLPVPIRVSAKQLFEYLFSATLNSYGKLKDHYKLIFDSIESNICPFCGIELLNRPSIIRQDYDHLMKQSAYTFVTVNMENLVPTGVECNRINKHNIDALYFNNLRSVFNSPYTNNFNIRISLLGSTPPTTIDGNGNWIIGILPDNDYTRQWEYVYNIRARYKDNILHKFYKNWLKELRTYLTNRNLVPVSSQVLETELLAQSTTWIANPTTGLTNIVRGAFYEFLIQYNDPAYRASILNYINN